MNTTIQQSSNKIVKAQFKTKIRKGQNKQIKDLEKQNKIERRGTRIVCLAGTKRQGEEVSF